MDPLNQSNWITSTHDAMNDQIRAHLKTAGFIEHCYLIFSIFETVNDGVKDDMSDWIIKHPDFAAPFAPGKVQFVLGYDEEEKPVLSEKTYVNPIWGDVLEAGEWSCRARGAPELDHVFMESVEFHSAADDVTIYSFHWGS